MRHFDKYLSQGSASVSVLRVYDPDRRTSTVSDTVKRYCLLTADNSRFMTPTRADLIRHNVIVTTLVTSLLLTKHRVKGHFTHIFIDEAAQVCLLLYCIYLFNSSMLSVGCHVYKTVAAAVALTTDLTWSYYRPRRECVQQL